MYRVFDGTIAAARFKLFFESDGKNFVKDTIAIFRISPPVHVYLCA